MSCSKIISKDVRAVRSDCTTHEPTRAVRIPRLLFEIPILCLHRRPLERKSKKKRSKIKEKSIQNRSWAVLGDLGRSGASPRRVRTRPRPLQDSSRASLGRPGRLQERPNPRQERPRSGPGPSPSDSGTRPSATAAANTPRSVVASNFCRLWARSHAPGRKCCIRTDRGNDCIFTRFDASADMRARIARTTAKTSQKHTFRASESSSDALDRAINGQIGRKSTLEAPPGLPKIEK